MCNVQYEVTYKEGIPDTLRAQKVCVIPFNPSFFFLKNLGGIFSEICVLVEN